MRCVLLLGGKRLMPSHPGPMFTGIVEETGRVISFIQEKAAWRLKIAARVALENVALGDSIAINGCCLTVVAFDQTRGELEFDVLEETRRLTNLATLAAGSPVNLERSLRFDGEIGGHFVTGHIDGLGTIEVFEQRGPDHYLRVKTAAGGGRLVVQKGSIAIDGISLTVAEVSGDSFAVWLIPHTVTFTNLHAKRAGEPVNLEFDLLGKYVEKLLAHPQPR
jgi:riboflavin synthase